MNRLSFFKRLKLYSEYKTIIKSNSFELEQKFGLRRDRANRLYTVLNVPPNLIGENFNVKKSDIDKISESYIKEYSSAVASFLDIKGLKEMYDFYDIKKIEKNSYLIIFGPHKANVIDSDRFTKNLYYRILPISIILFSIISLILILK